jgi:hypothetical protein
MVTRRHLNIHRWRAGAAFAMGVCRMVMLWSLAWKGGPKDRAEFLLYLALADHAYRELVVIDKHGESVYLRRAA